MGEARHGMALPWAGAVLGTVVLGVLGTLLGDTAWPLVTAVLVVTTAVHAPRAGWRAAFFLTVLAALVLQVSYAWFTPHLGRSMATDNTVAWALVGLAAVPFAALTGPPSLSRRQAVDAVAVLVVPVGTLVYLAWTAATRYYDWLGWAMEGDAANNMLLVRSMIDEGGLLRSQGNGAPLSTVVYAAWGAPGLADASAAGVVRHLVLNGGQLTLLMGVTLSILASLLVLRVSPPALPTRVAAAVTAGLVPWLWCVLGYSFRQGFQNSAPAMAVLLLAWACWEQQRRTPVASLTGLILATWAAAAVWVPVLLIPAVWTIGVAVRERRALRASGRRLLLPLAALLGAGTYAVLVTLRDLTAQGGVPGVDGGHPNYNQWWSLAIGIAVLVLTVVCYRWLPRETTWGYWLAVPGIAYGVLQLIRARQAADLPAWGYYPIKFTWIVMACGVVILFSVAWPALYRGGRAPVAGQRPRRGVPRVRGRDVLDHAAAAARDHEQPADPRRAARRHRPGPGLPADVRADGAGPPHDRLALRASAAAAGLREHRQLLAAPVGLDGHQRPAAVLRLHDGLDRPRGTVLRDHHVGRRRTRGDPRREAGEATGPGVPRPGVHRRARRAAVSGRIGRTLARC